MAMRLTVIITILALTNVSAKSYSQNVTLNQKNISIEKSLRSISKQSGFFFLYDKKDIPRNELIDINVHKVSVEEALNQCLKDLPLTYKIIQNTIVLKKKDKVQNLKETSIADVFEAAIRIQGTVLNDTGQPLPGVTVKVKGTNTGTVTDVNGKYSIVAPDDGVLVFSFVGFDTYEQPITGRTTIDVTLLVNSTSLNAVTVVGYGSQRKSDLTGAVSTIETNTLTDFPALRVDQMLQGKASGMMVTQANGSPGAGASIRIRGNSSITASSEPLYVVDGLIGLTDISTINPADIANISILKDASATSIYGSRGANGVILITTKRGAIGSSQINVNVQHGLQWLPRTIDLLSGSEYALLLNQSRVAVGAAPIYASAESVQTTDWQKEVMEVAPMTDVNVSTSGGTEKINYFIAGNYFKQDGIIKNSGVERTQLRANVDSRFSEKIKLGLNLNVGSIATDNNTVSIGSVLLAAPSMPIFNPDGTYYYNFPDPQFNGRYNSPVAQQNLISNKSYRASLALNTYVEYAPFNWMTIKSTYGGQFIGFNRNNSYTDSKLPGQTTNQQFGVANVGYSDNTSYQNENTVNFIKTFNQDHFIDGIVGVTFQGGIGQNAFGGAREFISDAATWNNLAAGNPITRNIGSGYENYSLISYLARLTYKYKNRYLITATGRKDGSSRLGAGNKWATFPSLALGWVASEEPFIKDLSAFSFLKLRGSYGKVGNQAVGIYQTLSVLTSTSTIVNGVKGSGWAPGQVSGNSVIMGNPDLRWEIKNQLDLGLEANFFNNRLNFTFDYYDAVTSDLLLLTEIPSQTGYTQQLSNVGEVGNKGFDISLGLENIKGSAFNWSTQLTLSHNKNEVRKLGPTGADVITHVYNAGLRPVGVLRIGEPIGSFLTYVSDGIWKEAQGTTSIMPGAVAGSLRYKDINGDGKIDQKDQIISGNGSPSWFGGIGNSFTYKRFGLDVFFSAAHGAKIFNGNAASLRSTSPSSNHYREVADRWHPTNNPDSNVPGALNLNVELYPSDRWIFDASYMRLESANLYYNVPVGEKMKKYIKSANISMSGSNLFLLSPYNKWGYDPVINQRGGADLGYDSSLQGFDYGAYPRAAVFTFGANLTF